MPRADWMFTSSLSIYLNVFPPFLCFIIQFIRCKPHLFFITNLPKIKILFQIKKLVNKIHLTHIFVKEWNFLVVRSASLNISNIVVARWFPSKKSSNILLDFAYSFLTLFTKLVILITKIKELSLSEDWVADVVTAVIVMVVTVSPVSHQIRVSQGSDTNWCRRSLKRSTHDALFDGQKLNY